MTLATRCTACGTVFRVVQDQLRISEGWVRCGRCGEAFNAQLAMVDWPPRPSGQTARPYTADAGAEPPTADTAALLPPASAPADPIPPASASAAAAPTTSAPAPVRTVESAPAAPAAPMTAVATGVARAHAPEDTGATALAPPAEADAASAEAAVAPAAPSAPARLDLPAGLELVPTDGAEDFMAPPAPAAHGADAELSDPPQDPLPVSQALALDAAQTSAPPPPPVPAPAPGTEAQTQTASTFEAAAARPVAGAAPTPAAAAPDGVAPASAATAPPQATPSFMLKAERAARWRRPGVRATLALGCLLATLGLAVQVGTVWRDRIAAAYPSTRPWLQQACASLGCVVGDYRDIEALTVESSGLARLEGAPVYRLTVTLRNRSALAVAAPALDLAVTDAQGRPVARRMLSMRDLGLPLRTLSPGSELPIQAPLTVDGQVSGYTVEIFYP